MSVRKRLWLCVPPLLMYNLDVGLTLAGQNEAYWQGNYASPDELNPLAHFLLATHPCLFVVIALLWEVVFCGLILWLRPRLAVPVALVLAVGHAYGASTWMLYWGLAGAPALTMHLLTAAALIIVCGACAGVTLSARPKKRSTHTPAVTSTNARISDVRTRATTCGKRDADTNGPARG